MFNLSRLRSPQVLAVLVVMAALAVFYFGSNGTKAADESALFNEDGRPLTPAGKLIVDSSTGLPAAARRARTLGSYSTGI